MTIGRSTVLRVVVGLLLAALLTVEVVAAAPALAAASDALLHPATGWLAVAVMAEAASMGMFARLQRQLLRAGGVRVRLPTALAAVYAANALHFSLPGGTAFSTTYTFRRMRSWGASPAVAVWGMVAGGLISAGALIVIGLVGAVLAGSGHSLGQLVTNVAVVMTLAFAVRWVAHHPARLAAAGSWCLRQVNRLRRRPSDTGLERLGEIAEQLRTVRPARRDWLAAATFSLLNWILDLACMAACCAAVGLTGVSLPVLLVAYAAAMTAASVPVVPGGLGLVDGALALTFIAAGLPEHGVLAAVLLYRLLSFGAVVIVGWTIWLLQQLSARLHRTTPQRTVPDQVLR